MSKQGAYIMSSVATATTPPGKTKTKGNGPSLGVLMVIIIVIVVVILGIIIMQGVVTNGIVQKTSNQSLQEAMAIMSIILEIGVFCALIYCLYGIGTQKKRCAM